jgi:magnesium transporter
MLSAYPKTNAEGGSLAGQTLTNKTWIDLVDPTADERARFEAAFGLRVPDKNALGEIEATSRLQVENGALYMTAPLIFAAADEPWIPSPAGFVLSKQVLMTVRFCHSVSFDTVAKDCGTDAKLEPAGAFVRILEELVDHLADLLESAGRDLDDASHTIFRADHQKKLSRETKMLRALMIHTGRTSERMARVHYTLVCLDRMAKFTAERARDWIAPDLTTRLQSVSSDVASLVQFSEGLVSRVQLLQDAATGIINID